MSKFRNFALAAILALPSVAFAAETAKPVVKDFGLGTPATPDMYKAYLIDVRPDGQGAPVGKGSVKEGEKLFGEQCSSCHGDFGEGVGKFPVLMGGEGTLTRDHPVKTIGSYWPYASTLFDYINRAMPFPMPKSLTPDQVYSVTAWLLNQNNIVKDDFVLTNENIGTIKMPNANGFYMDDRKVAEKSFWNANVCMKNCKPTVAITAKAVSLNDPPKDAKADAKK